MTFSKKAKLSGTCPPNVGRSAAILAPELRLGHSRLVQSNYENKMLSCSYKHELSSWQDRDRVPEEDGASIA